MQFHKIWSTCQKKPAGLIPHILHAQSILRFNDFIKTSSNQTKNKLSIPYISVI